MASSLRRLYSLRNALHLLTGDEKRRLFELGPLSTSKAFFARAAQEEDVKKKKKKKEKKKEKKKGAKDVAGEDEKDRLRFGDLVVKALEAPSPVRHVKEKERLREQEMEKYGLMTKERHIELEQQKARDKAKEKAKKKKKLAAATEGEVQEEEEAEAEEEKPPLSKEEGMRLAKEYSRLLMREDRKLHAGETIRLRLKMEAIAALPPGLQEAARVPDMTPFPGLSPATLTPPIPGFTYEYERRIDKQAEGQQ